LELTNSILEDVRVAVGLSKDTVDFDTELLMHINSAIGELRQNGVTLSTTVTDASKTWADLQNPLRSDANEYFHMVPLFVSMSTKLIFDPPPPSTVEYYSSNISKILWRLKVAYEDYTTTTTTTTSY
jgi:hypothetical protein